MVTAQQAMDDPETRELFVESWPKTCSCCDMDISEEAWEKLAYVGIQKSGMDHYPDFELRNCGSCHSTLAVAVPADYV